MKWSLRRRALWSLSALICSNLFAPAIMAADRFWIGTTTDIWSDAAAWSSTSDGATPAAAPTNLDIARFNATGALAGFSQIKLNGDHAVQGIGTNAANGSMTTVLLGGDANHILSVGASGITHNGAGGFSIGSNAADQRVDLSLTDSQTWTSSAAGGSPVAIIVVNGVSLANVDAQTLTLAGINTGSRIDGVISDGTGTLSLIKAGTATNVWTLNGANTFSGGISLDAGILRLGNASALGTGTLTIGNGTSIDATGALTLSTNNAQNWNGNFTFAGTGNLNLGTGAVTLAATRTVTTTANTLTVGGVISGAGGLVKAGAGILLLGGTNSYTGKVQVNAGTLSVANDLNLGAVPGSFVADQLTLNGGTLRLTGGSLDNNRGITLTANSAITFAQSTGNLSTGVIDGAFQLTVNPTGAGGNYTPTAQNTYSGGTILNAGGVPVIPISDSIGEPGAVVSGPFGTGPVTFNGANFRFTTGGGPTHTLANDIIFAANTTFTTAAGVWPTLFSGPISITANRTITQGSAASFTFSNVVSDGGGNFNFTKAGTGQLILAGLNTYGGATTVSSGNLTIGSVANGGSPSALGQSSNAATNLVLGNGTTLQYIGGNGSTDRGFTINGTAADHGVTLNASGTGALVLSNTASPAYGTIDQTRTLTLTGTNTGANTLAAGITNNGTEAVSLTKTGIGRWVLSGASTFTGATTISDGTLQYTTPASAPAASIISLAAAGTLAVNVDGPGEFTSAGVGAGTLAGVFAGNVGGGFTFLAGSSIGIDTTNAPGDVTYAPVITNSDSNTLALGITKFGTGNLILSGANVYTGPTTVNGGTLKAGVATVSGVSGAFGLNSAVVLANNANTAIDITGFNTQIGSLAGGGETGGNVILGAAALTVGNTTNTTYAGAISGTGGLTKIGTGTLTLAGASTYDGVTAISGNSTLIANHAQALGSTVGNTTVSSGSSLALSSGVTITGETVVIEGGGVGSNGALTIVSGAALPATWDGPVILNGTLPRIGTGTGGSTLIVKGPINNGTSNPAGGADLYINTPSGSGIVEIATPAGLSTYSGATRIVRSTLRLGADDALPTTTTLDVHWTSATPDPSLFNLNGFNQTIGGLLRTGGANAIATVTNTSVNPSTLTINNTSNFSYGGIIAGANTSLAKAGAGTQTLSGINTYGGTTTITSGTLALSGDGTLGTGDVIVNGTLSVLGITPSSFAFGATQTVSGTGTILATGKPVTISGGLAPGNSPGTLSVSGDVTLAGSANSTFEILGPSVSNVDMFDVSGNLTYGGSLLINNNQSEGTFDLFDFASFTTGSDFATINLSGLYSGALTPSGFNDNQWAGVVGQGMATFDGTTGVLNLAVIPEPSTLVLGGLALLGFAGAGLRRRRLNAK